MGERRLVQAARTEYLGESLMSSLSWVLRRAQPALNASTPPRTHPAALISLVAALVSLSIDLSGAQQKRAHGIVHLTLPEEWAQPWNCDVVGK